MIKEDKRVSKLPSINLFEDVLSRDPGNGDGVYPFDGMTHIIEKQFASPVDKSIFDLQEFIEYSTEFNPAKVKIKEDEESDEIDDYATSRIEDFIEHPEYIEDWIVSQCIGFKKHDNSPFKIAKNKSGHTLRPVTDEDGVVTSEADWVLKDEDMNSDEFDKLISQAIFYFKLIWQESVDRKVNLISFLIAYDAITHAGEYEGRVSPSDFAPYHTFKLKGNGVFAKEFVHEQDNKGDYYRFGRAWVTGDVYKQNNQLDVFCQALPSFKASRKLLAICEQLGFPLRNEDPYEFNKEYIESMTCTYMPSNEEYISIYGEVDRELNYIFQSNKLFTIKDVIMQTIEGNSENFTTEEEYIVTQSEFIADCFEDISYTPTVADYDKAAEEIDKFLNLFVQYRVGRSNDNVPDSEKIVVTEGVDYYIKNNVVMKPAGEGEDEDCYFIALLPFMPSTGSIAAGYAKVFIHATGNAILLNNKHSDEPIHYISLDFLNRYLEWRLGKGECFNVCWSVL